MSASQLEMSSLKLVLPEKRNDMSVTADTFQVEMWPYVSSADSWSEVEVQRSTAVWSSDLEVKT